MKYFLTLIGLTIFSVAATAQRGLQLQILDEKGAPVSHASVQLKQQKRKQAGASNELGLLKFSDLPAGHAELSITAVGFESYQQIVLLKDTMMEILIRLNPLLKDLQAIEVVGRSARKYTSDYSFGATKFAVASKDIPQSVSAVTKELIADLRAFQLGDAVKMASGVVPSSYYNQYTIRGMSQNEEGQILNGMRTRQYYFLQPLTANIERVEVIKGPASATFSSVDPGGSINIITKKPLDTHRKEISISAGSFSTIRAALDFTGPLDKEKKLLYRVNGAYQEAKSFRDFVGNKSFLVSPSFSWVPDDKTAFNTEIILSNMNGNLDRGQPIFGAVAGQTDLKSTPVSLNLSGPDDYFKSKEFIIMGNFSRRITESLSLNISYMKQTWSEDLQEHRTTNAFGVDLDNNPVSSLAGMQFVQRKQNWNIDNLNGYLTYKIQTGKITHTILAGYDLHRWQKLRGGGQNAARGYLLKDGTVAASFNPARAADYHTISYGGSLIPKPNVNHFDLSNPNYILRSTSDYVFNVRTALPAALTSTQAVYIQEMMQWNRFTLLLSLRQEWFEDITNYKAGAETIVKKAALLPRVGLTWAATKTVNFYATYFKGFQPQSNTVTLMPNTGSLKTGAQFEPLKSDLKEAGLKADLLKGRMSLTVALYEIRQQNILINANIPAFPDSLATRGGEKSRGIEMELAGYLMPGWQLSMGYSYIDAVITQEKDPALIGARKQNTPIHSGTVWTRYNFPATTALKDLGVGAGLQYSGDKVPWFTRSFKLPAYTVLDLAVYYSPGKSNLQLAMNINNLLDKTYWLGAQNYLRLFPGAPRNIMFTATYRF
ncbi:MAG: TonB-dependent siderophore receptor [Pseudobacter sp.]|uniref:TonB-dependent siderophore receptor n=1 Tax=Pseudobacter sp. TaxID=2045420 RepID=UPI003F7E7F38